MKNFFSIALAMIVLTPMTGFSQTVIASDNFDTPLNRISLDITVDMAFMNLGDIFGVTDANSGPPSNTPFAVVDDGNPACPSYFPNDNQGVIPCTYNNRFFAMSDTENPDNMGPVSAEWVFDISGATSLTSISIDMSAMGDFETANDNFVWSYAIDGGSYTTIFDMMPDEAISADYNLQNGNTRTLNDPMKVNGVLLLNQLTTFTANISGSGNTLKLKLEGMGDGGDEAMAWDNIVIKGIQSGAPIPTMGEWALFIFALIMITLGVVFVFNTQQRLAFSSGSSDMGSSFRLQQLPFDRQVFNRALKHAFGLAIAGSGLILLVWGEFVAADLIGLALATPILAYLIHLVNIFGKND